MPGDVAALVDLRPERLAHLATIGNLPNKKCPNGSDHESN